MTTVGNPVIDEQLDFRQQGITSTGITMIHHRDLSNYAKKKGLKNSRVVLAIDQKSVMEYVILIDNEPDFASQQREAILCHIDILGVLKI